MYIYKITNNLNNKIYIGLSSKTPEDSTDYYGSGVIVNQAIDKHGKHNFTKTILERDIVDHNYLQERERHYIDIYNSTKRGHGYNITQGGGGVLGYRHTEETKRKIAESNRLKGPRSEETEQKIREANSGVPFTKERCERIRKALTGRKMSDEMKQKLKDAKAKEPRRTCPHCGVEGKGANMTRYHFDKCINMNKQKS